LYPIDTYFTGTVVTDNVYSTTVYSESQYRFNDWLLSLEGSKPKVSFFDH
jgi:hypothetical protein